MRALVETDNYAVIKCPDGNEGREDWNDAMKGMLNVCERLRADGYRPLHYVPRMGAWVCEKPAPIDFGVHDDTVKRWADEKPN